MKNNALLDILLENVNKKLDVRLVYMHDPEARRPERIFAENTARCPIRLDCDFHDIAEAQAYLTGLQRGFVHCEIKRELRELANEFRTNKTK